MIFSCHTDLVKRNPRLVIAADENSITPLHVSAEVGNHCYRVLQ